MNKNQSRNHKIRRKKTRGIIFCAHHMGGAPGRPQRPEDDEESKYYKKRTFNTQKTEEIIKEIPKAIQEDVGSHHSIKCTKYSFLSPKVIYYEAKSARPSPRPTRTCISTYDTSKKKGFYVW